MNKLACGLFILLAITPALPAAESFLNSPEAVEAYQVKDPRVIAVARKLLATPDSTVANLPTPNPHPDAQWFPQAGLGLFMHWGIHSVAGAQPSWSMIKDYRYAGPVKLYPPEKYFALAKQFHPDNWNPDKWLKAAEEAGFTYAVLTTKHHDGYALWPSAFGNFNTKQYLQGRDLLQPYVDACRKHHLKVGFYFSPRDWHYPNYPLGDVDFDSNKRGKHPPVDPKVNQARFEEFFTYTIGQLHELLTRYGKIDVLWFDGMGWNGAKDMHTKAVYQWIRSLQPGIIINDRWSKIRNPDSPKDSVNLGDFLTVECRDAAERPSGWWESCNIWTYGHWGYDSSERIQSLEWTLENLVRCRRWGGNYLPDLGPRPDGEMPREFYDRCKELRAWMTRHRQSVIGTTPLPDERIANVPVTCRKNTWYLHISPGCKRNTPITIQTNKTVQKAFVLGTGKPVTIRRDKGVLSLNPPDGRNRQVIVIVFKEG